MNFNFTPIPMDAPLTAGASSLDHASRNLQQVFAGCLLVPVPEGLKADTVPPPQAIGINTPDVRSRLAVQSIAVFLGLRSNGLCAIQFANQAALTAFLKRNPFSQHTLITSHAAGAVVWHRVESLFRFPLDLPGLKVQMTGAVGVFHRGGVRQDDVILQVAAPTRVNMDDVNWGADPDGYVDAWMTRLKYGEFFRRGGRGQQIPNTHAWRVYLAARLKPTTAYDTRLRQFFHQAGADWQPLTDAQLRDELRRLVHAAPVGTAEARARLTDEWLSRICGRLKSSLATQLPIIEDRLRVYLQQRLIKEPGANTTNAELFADYCNQAGQSSLSPMKFKMLIGQMLRAESWRAGYSKSIRRAGRQQNGWRGVRLRDQKMPSMTTHGAGGAPGVKS